MQQREQQQQSPRQFQEQDGRPGTSINNRRNYNNNINPQSPNRMQQNPQQNFFQGQNQSLGSPDSNNFRPISMKAVRYNQNQGSREMGFTPNNNAQFSKSQNGFFNSETPQNARFKKLIPKNMKIDKEELYKDNLDLRKQINECLKENNILKSHIASLDKQLSKGSIKENRYMDNTGLHSSQGPRGVQYVKDQGGPYATKSLQQQESSLVYNLKKQVKNYELEVQNLKNQIKQIKKTSDYTKILEQQIQIDINAEQLNRLTEMLQQKQHLDNVYKPPRGLDLQSQNQKLNEQIQNLKQDNINMHENLIDLQKLNKKFQIQQVNKERSISNTKKELKKVYLEKIDQEQKLIKYENKRDPHIDIKTNHNIASLSETQLKHEIERLKSDIKEKDQKISNLNRKQQDLEKKLLNQQKENEEKLNQELTKNQQLQIRKDELEQKSKKILEDYHSCITQEQIQRVLKGELNIQLVDNDGTNPQKKQTFLKKDELKQQQQSGDMPSQKRLARVNKEDVEHLGQDLKFRLMAKRIPLKNIDSYLFPTENQKSEIISIIQQSEVLKQEPFSINNQEDLVNLCRYLIEDNTLDYVIFDQNATQGIHVVKSTFKNLIQKYDILTVEEERQSFDNLKEVLSTSWKSAILDFLQRLESNGNEYMKEVTLDFCRKDDFDKSIQTIDTSQFSSKDLQYMDLKLYQTTNDLQKLSLNKFFDFFTNNDSQSLVAQASFPPRKSQQTEQEQLEEQQKQYELEQQQSQNQAIQEQEDQQNNQNLQEQQQQEQVIEQDYNENKNNDSGIKSQQNENQVENQFSDQENNLNQEKEDYE